MDFALPTDVVELQLDARAFAAETVANVGVHDDAWLVGYSRDVSAELGRRGWLGITWPVEHGGGGKSALHRFVLAEELLGAGVPIAASWFADRQIGPVLLSYGTDEQRSRFLPDILRGTSSWCIGMSEPGAGSDLASIRTRAVRRDGGWVINGSKLWTTNVEHAHFMIALVRTSGEAGDRHQGLSQLIVDLKKPGVTVRPIQDMSGDAHFCEVFFDQVQLDADALIGAEGQGWEQVTAELAYERSGPERIYSSIALAECWVEALRRSTVAGLLNADFHDLLGSSIPFNRYVMDQLNERLGHFIVAREIDRQTDPDRKVAGNLAQLFNPVLYPGVGGLLRITQQEIGYLVGLSRQRVNEALRVLHAGRDVLSCEDLSDLLPF